MFSSKRDYFEWTIQQLLRGAQRRFPSTYMYSENTFQAIQSSFISLEVNAIGATEFESVRSSLRGRRRKGRGREKSAKAGKRGGSPLPTLLNPPSLFPFLPIPYLFRRLLRRLVRSSQGNLSLFEITRASVLFFRQFQVRFKVLRK